MKRTNAEQNGVQSNSKSQGLVTGVRDNRALNLTTFVLRAFVPAHPDTDLHNRWRPCLSLVTHHSTLLLKREAVQEREIPRDHRELIGRHQDAESNQEDAGSYLDRLQVLPETAVKLQELAQSEAGQ